MTIRRYNKVGVLMGGPSSEREVSLRSGQAVARGLAAAGYEVTALDVTSDDVAIPAGIEAVFVALHGRFGEDGRVQQLLQDRGVPYTGSSPTASRRSFDKTLSIPTFEAAGLPVPRYEILREGGPRTLPLPVVTKPPRQGSSIGVHRVFAETEWSAAFEDTLSYDGEAIVETFIAGAEITAGIVGGDVLPLIEIRAPDGYYNYQAKYTKGLTEYIVPAQIPAEWTAGCQDLARRAFRALGCRGMGRADFRMTPQGEFYLLELNNIPGFTETSLLPKAAQAAGMDFPALCDRIMSMACLE
ncbi:MAG: D-alanine--D-alanine ligase [Kiritimatiellae bacterium]|nr:D-alanine--D-alanine ligase [Kiritimatiellia bacterium]